MGEPELINGSWEQTIAYLLSGQAPGTLQPINGSWKQTIAYLIYNLSGFSGGTIDNLTVTGNTIVGPLTAGTITSPSILWEIKSQDNNGLIAPKHSNVGSTLNVQGSIGIGGVGDVNPIAIANSNNSFVAGLNGSIQKSNHSFILGRGNVFNGINSGMLGSTGTIGEQTSGNKGVEGSLIIGSNNSTLFPVGPSATRYIRNSSIISSKNSTINNVGGQNSERIVLIGMDNYTTNKQGVHVENLYITSGATENYVLTSEADGRAVWKPATGGSSAGNIDGGTPNDILIFANIDGGGV